MYRESLKHSPPRLLSQRKSMLFLLAGVSALLIMAPVVRADDINPPDYRDDPNSVRAHWMDFGLGLELVDFVAVGEQYPLSGGFPEFRDFDIVKEFHMPNFVDPLPLKRLRIQVTYSGSEPMIFGVTAEDPLGVESVTFVDRVYDIPQDPLQGYYYEDWEIVPNPDFEFVSILNLPGTIIHQVVIDTVSVPEPATLGLLGFGALAVIRKRRKK